MICGSSEGPTHENFTYSPQYFYRIFGESWQNNVIITFCVWSINALYMCYFRLLSLMLRTAYMLLLNEHNTVFASNRSAICNRCFLGPPESSTQTASRSCQPFLPGSLGNRPTDHATRSVTIGGAHSRKAKFCYCVRLQQVLIAVVDWTNRINFSNQYSAVRLDGLQCMWRQCNIASAYWTDDTTVYLLTYLLTYTTCLIPAFDDT